jgi:hypothetical protein
VQIPTADGVYDPQYASLLVDNGYTLLDALIFPLISPPESLEDTLLPLESSKDIAESNVRGHMRTRQTQTRVILEEPREVDYKYSTRKTHRKH